MVALFLMTTNQRRRRRQGERQKIMSILTNNNFTRASRYFVHFFAVAAPKLPNFSSLLNGVDKGEHKTKNCRFLFLNSDNDRYGPNEDLPN